MPCSEWSRPRCGGWNESPAISRLKGHKHRRKLTRPCCPRSALRRPRAFYRTFQQVLRIEQRRGSELPQSADCLCTLRTIGQQVSDDIAQVGSRQLTTRKAL